jgi:hypothetical protein
MDRKKPLTRFAQWWEEPVPADLFDRFPTTNIQIMLGRYRRLLVLDLDGGEAVEAFDEFQHGRPIPPTWITHSGGDGHHVWFRLRDRVSQELPKAILWKGEGAHSAIERLCDRSLVVAPPSIHPTTGAKYRFLDNAHSPKRLAVPALCPDWILGLKPVAKPVPAPVAIPVRSPVVVARKGKRYRADDVLDAVGDKVGLAASWGLRVASRVANHAGWCPCHAVGREDRNPSAAISATTGRYWEPGERTVGLFDLAVKLGIYLNWEDALLDMGERYRVREAG